MTFRQIGQNPKYKTVLQFTGKDEKYRCLTEGYHQGVGDEYSFIKRLIANTIDIYDIESYYDIYEVIDPVMDTIAGHLPERDLDAYFFHISIEFDHDTGAEKALIVEVTFYDLNTTMADRKQIGHVKASL